MKRLISLLILVVVSHLALGQTKLALKDPDGYLNNDVKQSLRENLATHSITLTSMVDFDKLSEYKFALLKSDKQQHMVLELLDHKDKLLGRKSFESDLRMANDEEKVVLLSIAIRQLLANEGKIAQRDSVVPDSVIVPLENQMNEHNTRYFFAPTAYSLRQNEFYYNTLYFGVHDIQYGFSDNFSLGMGSSIAFMPVYFTPKFSIPLAKNHTVGVGTLLGIGTYFQNWFMNLAYVNYSIGDSRDNLTFAFGYLNSGNSAKYPEIESFNDKVVVSLSGMKQLGPHLYFISENYWLRYSPIHRGSRSVPNGIDEWGNQLFDYQSISAFYNSDLFMGFLGTRWVMKKKDTRSWQFGIVYINDRPFGKAALDKKLSTFPYNQYDFNEPSDELFENMFLVLPAVTYTYKFGYKMK